MIRSFIRCGALAGVVALAACDLEVINPNQPGTERVLATPADVENLLGTQYKRWHQGAHGALANGTGAGISNILGMINVLSFENFSSLANNGMGAVISIPRSPLNNAVGNGFATEQAQVYYITSEAARVTSTSLGRLNDASFTLGSTARDQRARAFAEFVRGLSLATVAIWYDSGAVIHPELGAEEPGEIAGYQEVMTAALGAFQAAIDAASSPGSGSDGFPLPGEWLPAQNQMTAANFVRLVRSYRARFRASVARTPAERAAVDWDAVIADVQAGITETHYNLMSTTVGPRYQWIRQYFGGGLWHQMTPFTAGMADVSGSYAEWIAQPLEERGTSGQFFMVTPDQRWPQGATRGAQQADFTVPCTTIPCKRYFENRPTGQDNTSGASWGWSVYRFARYHPWHQNGRSEFSPGAATAANGYLPLITKAEMDLLEAEGHFRKGNYAAAAALVNNTRVGNGGLPAITVFDATTPVPGGNECVPKTPVNAGNSGGGTVTCGNLFEALKYEKRIETIYTYPGAWFLDGRGWGDLPENTALHWAPPFGDYQARARSAAIYSTGGGGPGSAARSGYGW